MASAAYRRHGNVAVITLDNPPVNGLGHALRSEIGDGLDAAGRDSAVAAIVIIGAGSAFSGGADIREFGTPLSFAEPMLRTVIRKIESSAKPVIAAIHSVAMGGGLELALGCHFRVASPGARIALPEVKLGLLPGAGGTQRLPRIIGLEAALNMIVSGATKLSEQFANTPLFDRMIEGDLLQGALAFAATVVGEQRPLRMISDLEIRDANAQFLLQAARDDAAGAAKHLPAPLACVEAVAAAVTMPFEGGMQRERELFLQLLQSPESCALRHAFFAERAAGKVPGLPESTPTRAIEQAAIVGAGTMGGGIAMNFINAGIPVVMLDTTRNALDAGVARIRGNYENSLSKGKLTLQQVDQRMNLLTTTLSLEDIGSADVVLEAVFEQMSVKEDGISQARRRDETGRDPGDQHIDAGRRPDRRIHTSPTGRDRHALLQPGERDETAGGRARQDDIERGARDDPAALKETRQDRRRVRRMRRIHRQSHA